MQKSALVITFLLLCLFTEAQQRITYRSSTGAGILTGERSVALQATTTHGLQWKQNFVGAGIGIDLYEVNTLPVFISLSREIVDKDNIFLTANLGTNIAIQQGTTRMWNTADSKFTPGFFGEFGVNHLIENKKIGRGMQLGVFYSYKKVTERLTINGDANKYEYLRSDFRRWLIRIGVVL